MARVKFYANRVITGRMTLKKKKKKYREQVKQYLESL